jgi:hypothetical protein
MPTLQEYAQQSPYSDPREYTDLLRRDHPADVAGLGEVVRNLLTHYCAPGHNFSPERLAEINNRWVDRVLACDQSRFAKPLDVPRPEADRVLGCCRDFTLLTVAALRAQGIPARSRVGFAAYFEPGFHHDHVITEYWAGERWVFADTQLEPSGPWSFDTLDLSLGPDGFETAAHVWTAYRRGDLDVDKYGVGMELPLRGDWFVRNYVLMELAHRQRDELLLWDVWGAGSLELDGDLGLIDEVAAALLAADGGDERAERWLVEQYVADARLYPGDRVRMMSPSGDHRDVELDLAHR